MEMALFILFMIIIGALIGGMTNVVAIKMLFRPYDEKKICRWKVPLTPGLIPKRHKEIASQLGKMVATHLLTAEGLSNQLKNAAFIEQLTKGIQAQVLAVMRSEVSISELLEQKAGWTNPKLQLQSKLKEMLEAGYDQLFLEYHHTHLSEVIPERLQRQAQASLPKIAEAIIERSIAFFDSTQGKERLSEMIERFFWTIKERLVV